MSSDPVPLDLLRRESRSLVQRLRLWTPVRYAAAAPAWGQEATGSRGDLVHHLAQAMADIAADLEDRPRRALPRLDSDFGLADQLAVTSDDLVRCSPPEAVCVIAAAHLLAHRVDLLADEVPPGIARALGLSDVVTFGHKWCKRGKTVTTLFGPIG